MYANDYKVFIFSRKNDLEEGYSTRDMARDQAEAMKMLGIKSANILGISQGGMIAQYLAIDYPDLVVLAVLVGIPMYADIFGTIPIAEALLAKGALLGTVLSFMMAVTTLSLPSMIMLRKAVKPKLLGLFIGICTIGIIVVGYFFNAFQYLLI
ncbi:MAG: alpha/beta fold hydrolase [Oliverpabstia sp.]